MSTLAWDRHHAEQATRLNYPDEHVVRFLAGREPGTSVLDIGCGTGRHLRLAAELGLAPVGLDFSEEALVSAQGEWPLVLGDLHELPFDDGSFAIVLAVGSLYYGGLLEMVRAVAEIVRVLEPGGLAHLQLRSIWDSRRHGINRAGTETWVLDRPESELGMKCTFLDEKRLAALLEPFSRRGWALAEVHHKQDCELDSNGWRNSDWIVRAAR